MLFLQSELTDHQPRVYTDNIQMTRWLQGEIQGRINPTFGNLEISAREARFRKLWGSEVLLDGRRDIPDMVRPGRALSEPQAPRGQSRAPPRCSHSSDSG